MAKIQGWASTPCARLESKRVGSNRVNGSLKMVSNVFQENFKKDFKGLSKMFHLSFVLEFCSYKTLITATRADEGLVITNTRL